jgi:hypothetical protein
MESSYNYIIVKKEILQNSEYIIDNYVIYIKFEKYFSSN